MNLYALLIYNEHGLQFSRTELTGEPTITECGRRVVGGRLRENNLPTEVLVSERHTAILIQLTSAIQQVTTPPDGRPH